MIGKEQEEQNDSFAKHRMTFRQQEVSYGKQIFYQYITKNNQNSLFKRMFQTLHSDWLHLEESHMNQNNQIQSLKSKANYNEGDIVMEIRGSIINKKKLQIKINQESKVKEAISKVNCLVWDQQKTQILVPHGISRKILSANPFYMSFVKANQDKCNCFIEYETGSKFLISTLKQIKLGQDFILDFKSLQRFLYSN